MFEICEDGVYIVISAKPRRIRETTSDISSYTVNAWCSFLPYFLHQYAYMAHGPKSDKVVETLKAFKILYSTLSLA